jgi:outer membrane protein OmpA-like peptidoglycan-associated protein
MKKYLSLFSLLFVISSVCAQEKATTNVFVSNFEEQPIAGAEIQFFNTSQNITIDGVAGADGRFIVELPAGLYNIRLKCMGKTKDYTAIEIPTLKANEIYNDVSIIIQYEEESSFTLSDLHFETAKAIILKESYNELDELVNYLKLKTHLKIEIAGHTDSDGAVDQNLILSQKRAEAVKNYLVNKGINANRMVAKGYGESKPIAENETLAGKALNRRTEINVIE